ncbi:MAG: isopentenyl phosphate kinase family protein [Candidatus Aenigmarchaeota archaeon]|nr:isopentenyl phosphate kinase family protein [Candidatus Aenigmarchaeota archaeon]
MKELIMVKLGGSLITDKSKPYTLREDVLDRMCDEIAETVKAGCRLLIGHGAGSFGHVSAKKYRTNEGFVSDGSAYGLAMVSDDAVGLNRIVVNKLLQRNLNAIHISTSSSSICMNGEIKDFYIKPLEEMLRRGMLPVIHGDVAMDTGKGCCIASTDEEFAYLAKRLGAKKIIMCGKTDGVYDSKEKTIPIITRDNFDEIKKHIYGSDGVADVTGGMIFKIEKSLQMADDGIETWIINGLKENDLKKAILGEKVQCTIIK